MLKGYTAPIETLLSSLPYSKPELRKKMTPEILKTSGMVRNHLKEIIPVELQKKRKKREATIGIQIEQEQGLHDNPAPAQDRNTNVSSLLTRMIDEANTSIDEVDLRKTLTESLLKYQNMMTMKIHFFLCFFIYNSCRPASTC